MTQDDKPGTEVTDAFSVLTSLKLESMHGQLLINPKLVLKIDYSDSTRYRLTKCITDFINLSGGIAVSVSSFSRYKLTQYWVDRKTRLELGDIIVLFQGKLLHVEVKRKDNYNKVIRVAIRAEAEKSGMHYFNAHTFQSFYEWFHSVTLNQG